MKRIYTTILLAALSVTTYGQSPDLAWTLEECISHALEHNLSIRQRSLQVSQQEIELNTATNSRLPRVSGSVGENFSFGRGLTADNTYANRNTSSTSFSLGASVPVFQGMRIHNTIEQARLNLDAATADLEKARDDISVAVARAYMQILYDMEILDVAVKQVAIDSAQAARLEAMMQEGKASRAVLAQQEAALGQSRLSATQAANNLRLAELELSQLLELPSPDGFTVVRPEAPIEGIMLENPESIYAEALGIRPAIRAEELRLDAAEWTIRNARSAYLPTLSASGGIGTNYYTMGGVNNESFGEQARRNFSQYIGLSLSIPIFSGFQTRNQVRSAELGKANQELQLATVKNALYKEIQQAYYGAVSAREKYYASETASGSAEESYRLVTARYENGTANITEFNESRESYLKSRSNLAQARYEYLFQACLLDFYKGGGISLQKIFE